MNKRAAMKLACDVAAGLLAREAGDAGAWADDMPDEDVERVQDAFEELSRRLFERSRR